MIRQATRPSHAKTIAPRSPTCRWRLALTLLLACATASCPALADPPPPAGTAASAAVVPVPDADAVRYSVVIDAPKDVVEVLRQSVGLVRWQSFEGMTDDLIDRLARFIDGAVDRSTKPITITLKVALGVPTRIHDVRIEVTGPAERDDAQGAEAIAKLRRDWGLPQGAIFDQTTWDRAKARAVQTLAASPYAAAAITSSAAPE